MDERGFIAVDKQMRTTCAHIFAIGDMVGQPMLAHKASTRARWRRKWSPGKSASSTRGRFPSVAYTDPEVAWVGVTETEAKAAGPQVRQGGVPLGGQRAIPRWAATRARRRCCSTRRAAGIGCGIVGLNAGDLIAEAALAIEMGADADDIGLTDPPTRRCRRPSAMAAEPFEGTITDLYLPRRK